MICAIGQDSHRLIEGTQKPLLLGGVKIEKASYHCQANSDGDVIFHALTNAVSGITCRNILGEIADEMCQRGIIDSGAYLDIALEDLRQKGMKLTHVSFTVECKRPRLSGYIDQIRQSVAQRIHGFSPENVGITATSGEGLTAFGRGEGISVFCIVTAARKE